MAPTTATKKAVAAKKPSSHPTFLSMIQECIKANPTEARNGVSRPTIKKFLADKYKLDMSSAANSNNLANAIKRGEEKGDLNLPKGISGRIKLPAKKTAATGKENAPPKSAAAAKPTPAKKAPPPHAKKAAPAKKTAAPAKKPVATKAVTKTVTKSAGPKPAKTVAKKPAAKKTSAPKKAPAAKAAAKTVTKKAAAPKKKVAAKK